MAVAITDIKLLLTGGAANTDPNLSLGGVTNLVAEVVSAGLNNLFDNVLPGGATSGETDYRAIAIRNTHASDTAFVVTLYIDESLSAFSTFAIGIDSVGTQATASESTAPVGVTFTSPLTLATGLVFGDVTFGSQFRLWIRRVITAGAPAAALDAPSLNIAFNTA